MLVKDTSLSLPMEHACERLLTCTRGDAYKASDHALHSADHRRLAEEEDVKERPHEEAGGRADMRVEHRHGRIDVGRVGVAAVEACPSKPKQAGPRQHQQDVVGREPLPVRRRPRPHPERRGEAGDPRGEVDDVAAGVVNDAPLEEEAAAPEREGADGVGEGDPERHEGHPRLDVHARQQGPREEDDGDAGEHALEVDHGGGRVQRAEHGSLGRGPVVEVVLHGGGRELRPRHQEALPEGRPGFAPEGEELVAERHVVRPHHPADPDGGEGVQRHEGRVDSPLLLHDAAVQDHQPRHALQAHQCRRCHLPRIVALVQPLRRRRRVLVRQRYHACRHGWHWKGLVGGEGGSRRKN